MKKQLTVSLVKSEWPSYGIKLDESHHSPDFSMEPITRDYFKVFYVISGRTTIWIDGKFPVALNEKDILAVPKGTRHLFKDLPEHGTTSIYILSIKDSAFSPDSKAGMLLSLLNSRPKLAITKFSPLSEEFADLARLLRKIKAEENRKGLDYELAIKSEIVSLLVRVRRAYENRKKETRPTGAATSRQQVKGIHQYITRNFFEPLTVGLVAGMC